MYTSEPFWTLERKTKACHCLDCFGQSALTFTYKLSLLSTTQSGSNRTLCRFRIAPTERIESELGFWKNAVGNLHPYLLPWCVHADFFRSFPRWRTPFPFLLTLPGPMFRNHKPLPFHVQTLMFQLVQFMRHFAVRCSKKLSIFMLCWECAVLAAPRRSR